VKIYNLFIIYRHIYSIYLYCTIFSCNKSVNHLITEANKLYFTLLYFIVATYVYACSPSAAHPLCSDQYVYACSPRAAHALRVDQKLRYIVTNIHSQEKHLLLGTCTASRANRVRGPPLGVAGRTQ
jgi:hypothetical protein